MISIVFVAMIFTPFQLISQIKINVNYRYAPLIIGVNCPYSSNDSIVINQLKFYLGTNEESVHLFDLEDPNTNVLLGNNITDTFTVFVGMDSTLNTLDRLDGPFDPLLGMYWAWNTGYIQLKISGIMWNAGVQIPFDYHIGGYRQPFATNAQIRTVIRNGELTINLNEFIDALPIKNQPKIMLPGPMAHDLFKKFVNCFP